MRPARMPASRVKILPWHYEDRTQPSRMTDETTAFQEEAASNES